MIPDTTLLRKLTGCVLVLLVFSAGCSDFFSQQPTEIQTNRVLHNLSKIEILPDVERPYPVKYTAEPTVIVDGASVKLYYFVRNQPVDILAGLLNDQFDFFVNVNTSTNQLVVKLASESEAEAALVFLDEVDIPPIQIKVDCLISEIFAGVTMDYETTADITDLFGIDATIKAFLPGASARSPTRSEIGMQVGITRNDFDLLVDILVSRGYAKILMNPTLEVVNGTTARIETTERVPVVESIFSGGDIVETIKYQEVMDYLEVTPQVYADGTIGLKTKAGIASRTITSADQAPIITTRTIDSQENRLRKGQSLVIGGIRKTQRVSVIRGVPFLKDLPLVGVFFSSKDFEDQAKEILFILTPSISSGGQDYPATLQDIREKHAKPEYKNFLDEILTGPFGSTLFSPESSESSGPKEIHSQAKQARNEALRAQTRAQEEIDRAELALAQAQQARQEAEEAQAQAQQEREGVEKARVQAQQEIEKAKQALAQALQAKQAADEAQAQAQQVKQDAEGAKAQAQQEREGAEQSQAQSQQAKQAADEAQAQAQREREEAEKVKAQAQQEKEDAEKAKESPAPEPPAEKEAS